MNEEHIVGHRAIFLIISFFIMAMFFAFKDCKRYRDKDLRFKSYITEYSISGKVTDIEYIEGLYRIELNDSDWFYPQYQISYLKNNLSVGDSIVKKRGKGVTIIKKGSRSFTAP